jgi:hypothetical protein
MGLELKRRSKQFLKKIPNARDIDEQEAFEVFGLRELPSFLGEGKNSFRIRPQLSRDIIPNTKIQIEVLDSNGNPVYWEVPSYKDDDKSQVISIWVYNDNNDKYNTPDGVCEIILVASTTRGPIRGTLKVNVVKNKQSASDIIFVDTPNGDVSASVDSFTELPQTNGVLSKVSVNGEFTYKKSIYGDDVSFKASTSIINGEMLDGTLELDLSSTTLFPRLTGGQPQPTRVTSSITEVITNNIFRVGLPITSSDNRSDGSIHTYEYSNDTITGTIRYQSTGSLNTTQNQVAVANITLSNVNPVSGRISSVNTLIKSQGLPNSDFEIISNTGVPNEPDISYKVVIPTEQLNDPKTLKIQFLNKNGNVSNTEILIEGVIFEGGNVYIGGSESIITGSIFVSNAIGSGLEIGGHSSGFMKSVGYEGQISASEGKGPGGFIIYSGSNALQMGADVLQGVGMQFVGDNDDRHLIFTTANGGILDVKTDKFFIGTTNTQFISGSDSNIEISSSLFHLDPKNDRLVIGADAIIEADLSANNIRTPATIGGVQSTDLNASSSITQDGFARFVSASIAGFTVNTEEIKSSDDSLRLKSNGQMTGSAILLGDKVGGNFVQFADSTLTVRGDLAVDQITTPSTIGGAPSNLTNASASITADGFAKFVSASIGGWDITTGSIEGSNLIMKPAGILQTRDFASGVKGWKISSELNGYAEFENVKIRGTLATTTFEKESVNAVGGQLYVANSTTLSGSYSSSIDPVSSVGVTSSTTLPTQFGDNSTDKIEFPQFTPYQLVSVQDSTKFTIDTPLFVDGGTAYLYYSSSNTFGSQISASEEVTVSTTIQYSASFLNRNPVSNGQNTFEYTNFNVDAPAGYPESDFLNEICTITEVNGAVVFSNSSDTTTATLTSLGGGGSPNEMTLLSGSSFNGTYGGQTLEFALSFTNSTSVTEAQATNIVHKKVGIWPTSIVDDGEITFDDGGGSHTFDILERVSNTQLRIDTSSHKPNTSASFVAASGKYSQSLSDTRTISAGTFTTTEFVYTDISPTASIFIADNVTGFANGEILTLKKVTNTGFATEYVKVDSAARRDGGSDSDLSGYLTVTRSYGSGVTGDSSSLGDIASVGQSYEEGQVIVSTGKIGSGYIRLNANPNDPSTPYMDIVERTGSGLYDIELKARLGDLSGLANSDLVHGRSNPGFGLATDNVYLQGGIIATFGEIGGFGINATTISSSNNNLILRSNGQITGSAALLSGSDVVIDVEDFTLNSTNFKVNSAGDITGSNVLFDGGVIGGFELGSNIISSSNGDLVLKSNGEITGSNVLFNNGVVGGFEIGSNQISASNSALILKNNGQITGSAVRLTTTISSQTYEVLDTTKGIIDAKNVGRQLYMSADEHIFLNSNGNSGKTVSSDKITIIWQGFRHETRVNISFQGLFEKHGTGKAVGGFQGSLYTAISGSNNSADTYYDNWQSLRTNQAMAVIGTIAPTTPYSASESNVGSDAFTFEIDNYTDGLTTYNHEQYQTQLFKLELEPYVQNLITTTGTSRVKIKNISVWTSRGLASTFAVATQPPDFGGFGGV